MATKKGTSDTPSVEETREQEREVEEAAAEANQPTEFYEVQVNRKLIFTDRVSVAGLLFFYDNDRNRREGTWIVDDVQWEGIKGAKDSETTLQLITRKSTVASEGGDS